MHTGNRFGRRRAFHEWNRLGLLVVPGMLILGIILTSRADNTQSWTLTGSLATARQGHTATRLNNGTVLVAGGMTLGNVVTDSSELYNPSTGVWTPTTGTLDPARMDHTATLLQDGTVLVVGGQDGNGNTFLYYDNNRIYNPSTGNWWTPEAMLITPRFLHTATLLPDGTVLVVGGAHTDSGVVALSTCEIYNPTAQTWTAAANLNTPRMNHTATLMPAGGSFPNGLVLVAGGQDGGGDTFTSCEILDLSNPSAGWTMNDGAYYGGLNTARFSHTATLLPPPSDSFPNGLALVTGGMVEENGIGHPLSDCEIYDPNNVMWTPTAGVLNTARSLHTATLLQSGWVLVTGGQDSNGNAIFTSEIYNPNAGSSTPYTGTWMPAGSLNSARYLHTATLLPDGTVLVAGGQNPNMTPTVLSSSEIYYQETQQDVLVSLYNSTGGASWNNNSGWLSTDPVCTWNGVSCDGSGNVTSLILSWNNLSGTIPDSIGNLSSPAVP